MKVTPISSFNYGIQSFAGVKKAEAKNTNAVTAARDVSVKGMNGEEFVMTGKAAEHFRLTENLSNAKVGSKFVIEPKDAKYEGLRLLITPDSEMKSDDMFIGIKKEGSAMPNFKGRLYGSIRKDDNGTDHKMESAYIDFWNQGMHSLINEKYLDTKYAPQIQDDYNFFIPTDGDGTRYKDITELQGGVTKPASDIPATLNGKNMKLAQTVIANYARTGKLDKMYDFVKVKPAQGSAFAFLEALRTGQLSDKKPVVYSWGDNFTDLNISKLIKDHEEAGSGFTITALPVDKERTKKLSILKIDSLENKSIQEFVEKPQDDDFIDSCVVEELGKDKCIAAVGPYVISAPVLKWIKENYTANPESFLNPDKGYDFSSMIITPALEAFKNGEILAEDGTELSMKLELIENPIDPESNETWSDLGAQKDFSTEMMRIKGGKFSNLVPEMLTSIKKNVDDAGNITFNATTRRLFDELTSELNIDAKNVLAYYKE